MHTLDDLEQGRLADATHLKLACGLTDFPEAIFDLVDTLEVLDLAGNALTELPDDLYRLRNLRVLFCSNNPFTELPPALGKCESLRMIGFKANRIEHVPAEALPPRLRWLTLTDNAIETLPDELGRCADLQKLMLAGNRLSALPDSLSQCHKLELIRLSANRFRDLPAGLSDLPRLSWLAFGGNPLTENTEQAAREASAMARLAWDDFDAGDILGEGASGVIFAATWRTAAEAQSVAVKRFKGAVTSDGLPLSEMTACLTAGAHPNLIPLLGRSTADDGAEALIMSRLPPSFRVLAGPPSFESCTRDVYADDLTFTPQQALGIATDIASAVAHLHARGLTHGDLYAHNILFDGETALIGDFGAASLIPPSLTSHTQALQHLDVRAFGCLLEELAARVGKADASTKVLAQLAAAGLSDIPAQRPLFADILTRLEASA